MAIANVFAAADLVAAEEGIARGGNPPWLNVIFSGRRPLPAPIRQDALGGAGLYAIFLDDRLLYIGIFVGPSSNLAGGSVLQTRWIRHVGTITMRGRGVSLRANVGPILAVAQSEPLAALAAAFANSAATLHIPQGMEMAARKVRFAVSEWGGFSGPIGKTLARIRFGYVRLEPGETTRFAEKVTLSGLLGMVEKKLVAEFKPPLNTAHNALPQAAIASAQRVMPTMKNALATALAEAAVALPEEAEEIDPADQVLDELSVDALTLVDELVAAVNRTPGLILYYTHGRDEIRLGPEVKARRRERPYLVLRERARDGSFMARSTLPVEEACALKFKASPTSDPAMACTFPLSPGDGVADKLLELCNRAAARRRSDNHPEP